MKYFSLFSGAGGFELGIEKAYEDTRQGGKSRQVGAARDMHDPAWDEQNEQRASCIGFSEIDKYASAVLRYRFPNVKNYGDITEIDWSAVPDFDLLVGGSPCQDLSVAGKGAGLTGARSGLFYEYVRCLEQKKPDHFVWENVKGALSSNGGRDFAAILTAFSEAGYSLWWQVLNAKDFGVPQNRERVFIVGTREERGREVFFERESNKENNGIQGQPANTIKARYEALATGTYTIERKLNAQEIARQPLRFLERNQKNIEGDYAFTVDAGQTSGLRMGERIRRLTPRECERLMSWPDDWTRYGDFGGVLEPTLPSEISDSQRYKMCGNGVVSAVVCEIVKQHYL